LNELGWRAAPGDGILAPHWTGGSTLRLAAILAAIVGTVIAAGTAALAQQPPLKREVAPEYREAAEKRALEKQKLAFCQQKADLAKVVLRDRAKHIIECLDAK
jgi:hypothetical protein